MKTSLPLSLSLYIYICMVCVCIYIYIHIYPVISPRCARPRDLENRFATIRKPNVTCPSPLPLISCHYYLSLFFKKQHMLVPPKGGSDKGGPKKRSP